MRFRPSPPLIVWLAVASSLGCSSSSSDPGTPTDAGDSGGSSASGVDGAKLATDTTSDERKKICDWSATLWGGYGKSHEAACEAGTLKSPGPLGQNECVGGIAELPAGCPATVKQIEDCLAAQASASPCDVGKLPAACDVFADARCRRSSDAGVDAAGETSSDAASD